MSFLAGLAGGFGQALADDQKDKNEWLRDQKLMNKRYAMTTGTAALKKAQGERDTILRQANYIQKRGITKSSLMYLWDEGGVNAISDIYNLIQNTHKDATKEEINNMANAAKDYASAENKPFAEVLSNARGLYSQEMPKRKERTALQKIFGDPTNEAFYDDGSVYEGKYTVTDMYRIQGSGFEGGTGSVVFDEDAAPMKTSPQYEAAINNNIIKAREIISSKANIQLENVFTDATKSTTYKGILISSGSANDYSDMLNNPDLKPYAINILKPYIDAEMDQKGSVLNNRFVSPEIKNNIRQIMSGDFDDPEDVDITDEQIAEQIDAMVAKYPKLIDTPIVKYNEVETAKEKGTIPTTDYFFVDRKGVVNLRKGKDDDTVTIEKVKNSKSKESQAGQDFVENTVWAADRALGAVDGTLQGLLQFSQAAPNNVVSFVLGMAGYDPDWLKRAQDIDDEKAKEAWQKIQNGLGIYKKLYPKTTKDTINFK